jgi:NAD(P)H-hydrate epimerase
MAGPGNNGADALVMLRALLLKRFCREKKTAVLLSREPSGDDPRSQAVTTLKAMGVPVHLWNDTKEREELIKNAGIVIDGIAGTGLQGPLSGVSLEMVQAVNGLRRSESLVVSIDMASGCTDDFTPGASVVRAGLTLAIEPVKKAVYTPALRSFCGVIVPVRGIFPKQLLALYGGGPAETVLFGWKAARALIPAVPAGAYKYSRGLVEIHACDYGSCGAGRIAAKGASAAGAGLVRLVVDDELYPVLAPGADGIMVVPASRADKDGKARFRPDAVLLGPGWGRDKRHGVALARALEQEERGIPLVLDADGIALAHEYFSGQGKKPRFNGMTILTPHPGELEALSGVSAETLLAKPGLISRMACGFNAVLVFKSHVTVIAAPGSGNVAYVDGMLPVLASGGSGDLLAGFCAALAARLRAQGAFSGGGDSLFFAAVAAAALLVETGRKRGAAFSDPVELAGLASRVAGSAWLEGPGGDVLSLRTVGAAGR